MLSHERKYRDWLIEYTDAWKLRAANNRDNFSTNIGLDGNIGDVLDGKWYRGTYGWNFSFWHRRKHIYHENLSLLGVWSGMCNAYMATGDPSYVQALRQQIDNIYAEQKIIDGKTLIPHNYGIHIDRDEPVKYDVFDVVDKKLIVPEGEEFEGWYNWTDDLMTSRLLDIYLMSMNKNDMEKIEDDPLIQFLNGNNGNYSEQVL
ncbi:hypothetical protein ACFLSA_03005 [Bacteroidota bacterium]